jgi:hypothetical protein
MANREVYPASLFPLLGDVSATQTNTSVTVVGIYTHPVTSVFGAAPVDGLCLGYVAKNADVEQIGTAAIAVNGVMVSTDYSVAVNSTFAANQVFVKVNGVRVQ